MQMRKKYILPLFASFFLGVMNVSFAGVIIVDTPAKNDAPPYEKKTIENNDLVIPITVDDASHHSSNVGVANEPNAQMISGGYHAPFYRFVITPGQTVYNALLAFGMSHGWQIAWEIEEDYTIETSAVIEDEDLQKVMNTFAQSLSEAIGKLIFVKIYDGNKVLRVVYYK